MCKCTPEIRTPFCGKLNCEWPKQPGTRSVAAQDMLDDVLEFLRSCKKCLGSGRYYTIPYDPPEQCEYCGIEQCVADSIEEYFNGKKEAKDEY